MRLWSKIIIGLIISFLALFILSIFSFTIFLYQCVHAISNSDNSASPVVEIYDKPATKEEIEYWNKVNLQKERERKVKDSENLKEDAWERDNAYTPYLTESGGTLDVPGYHLTWYSSNTSYHIDTPKWRLDKHGFYREWDGIYWRFVVSMNTDQQDKGSFINIDGMVEWDDINRGQSVPLVVRDCGCDYGTIDVYVGW